MKAKKQLSILNTSELMKLVVLATFGQKDNPSAASASAAYDSASAYAAYTYAAYTSAASASAASAASASYASYASASASAYEVFKPLADKILLPNLIMFEKLKKLVLDVS